ncbi:hypothetical protein BgiMline_017598 [Biomphalaria glabrata]|nr:hypothetical protein BgiMline_005247 [Biomphalaria glabrata]
MNNSWILNDILKLYSNNTQAGQFGESEKIAQIKTLQDELYLTDGYYLIPLYPQSHSAIQKDQDDIFSIHQSIDLNIQLYTFQLLNTECDSQDEYKLTIQVIKWTYTETHTSIDPAKLSDVNNLEIVKQSLRDKSLQIPELLNNSEPLSILMNEFNLGNSLAYSQQQQHEISQESSSDNSPESLFLSCDRQSQQDSIISVYSIEPVFHVEPERSVNNTRFTNSSESVHITDETSESDSQDAQCDCLRTASKQKMRLRYVLIPEDQQQILDALPEWKSSYEPSLISSQASLQESSQPSSFTNIKDKQAAEPMAPEFQSMKTNQNQAVKNDSHTSKENSSGSLFSDLDCEAHTSSAKMIISPETSSLSGKRKLKKKAKIGKSSSNLQRNDCESSVSVKKSRTISHISRTTGHESSLDSTIKHNISKCVKNEYGISNSVTDHRSLDTDTTNLNYWDCSQKNKMKTRSMIKKHTSVTGAFSGLPLNVTDQCDMQITNVKREKVPKKTSADNKKFSSSKRQTSNQECPSQDMTIMQHDPTEKNRESLKTILNFISSGTKTGFTKL